MAPGSASPDAASPWRLAVLRAAPWLFIVIWSSGYVVAKAAAAHAEPLTFLLVRYAGVVLLMLALAIAAGAQWPSARQAMHLAVAGIGIQAMYLGGVWVAVKQGMPAAVAALIVNLQPVLTAAAGRFVGERVSGRQWLGLVLGLLGVALVVSTKMGLTGMSAGVVALTVMSLLAMTGATLYQKRYVPDFDLRTGQAIQFVASFLVTLPFALAFESLHIEWNLATFLAMAWSVVVLTGGGISLLFLMIRHGAATQVTSYMYLVPAVTALMAWLMFDERLGALAWLGMVVTIAGVALVVRRTS
jgi:drug/metabolite transporter (DMT)-like permease